MASLLSSIMKETDKCKSILAFVGSIHYKGVKECWNKIPIQSSLMTNESSGGIPPRIKYETDEELIEKHALMDVSIKTYNY